MPHLYPILDASLLLKHGIAIETFARELHGAGVRFLQYRDKSAKPEQVVANARVLRRIFPAPDCTLILNDRVELCGPVCFDGVHLGQGDMAATEARARLGGELLLGVSTHTPEQVKAADAGPADYLAIGPVYATGSKENPDPVVGLAGVRSARTLTRKPLVAIGGITRANCGAVLEAGADAVAVISELLPRAGLTTAEVVRDFLSLFR